MADQEPAAPPKPKSWYKAILGTIGGVLSGAVMMYVTPLVNQVIKTQIPKPMANFAYQADGYAVRFHNLSKYGSRGWWEFGDGSPLEEVSDSEFVEHTYQRPGDYSVKLSLQNALGDANDRTVAVHIDAPPAPAAPKIVSLEAVPVSAGSYAPATFKLVGKIEHADMTILDIGDDGLFQVATENTENLERLVTFQKPGGYVVKLAAINGAKQDQKTEIITVMDAPTNSLTAMLTVTDEATRWDTKMHNAFFSAAFPPDSREPTCRIDREVKARPGHTIADLSFKTIDGKEVHLGSQTDLSLDPTALGLSSARNLRLQVSDDKQTAHLTGELFRDPNNKNAPPPSLMIPVTLTAQKKVPASQINPVTTTLAVPVNGVFTSGTLALPPIPKDWIDCQRKFHLQVLDNGTKLYEDSQLQRSALVTLHGRKCILTTTRTNDQVRIDLMDAPIGVTSAK